MIKKKNFERWNQYNFNKVWITSAYRLQVSLSLRLLASHLRFQVSIMVHLKNEYCFDQNNWVSCLVLGKMYLFIDLLSLTNNFNTFGKELYKKSVFTAAVRSTSFLLLRMKHASASSILQNTHHHDTSVSLRKDTSLCYLLSIPPVKWIPQERLHICVCMNVLVIGHYCHVFHSQYWGSISRYTSLAIAVSSFSLTKVPLTFCRFSHS